MKFSFRPKHVAYAMLSCITLLLIAHLTGRYVRFVLGHDHLFGFIRFFNLNEEDNLPSLYSGLTLILSALLFLIIGITKRHEQQKFAWHWIGLGFIFLFLAADELFYFHERLDIFLRAKFHPSGMLFYIWIVPYLALTLAVGITYLRFFFALPNRFRVLFFSAAVLFIGGAAGMESFEGTIAETQGVVNFIYIACSTLEEVLEMLGIALLVYGLLSYIESEWGEISISLRER